MVPAEVSSPDRIEGRATLTMVTSSSDMNPIDSVTPRIRQRCGSGWYVGDVVVARRIHPLLGHVDSIHPPGKPQRTRLHHGPVGKAVDVTVTGRVQGVSFRWYTEQQAARLGVAGWVRNEPDGSVAGHFEGEDDAVDALVEWCRQRPVDGAGAQRRRTPRAAGRTVVVRRPLLRRSCLSPGCGAGVVAWNTSRETP